MAMAAITCLWRSQRIVAAGVAGFSNGGGLAVWL